ncbi:MAG: helix-turn-helix domain-containing protein [Clostridiales bacterium]|nr:helix-turn-helix domain-containing protein [Clostridiales bacterium]
MDEAVQQFLGHTNPFCMYIKSSIDRYGVCLSLIKKIRDKSIQTKDVSFGMCHAGLCEYLIPIWYDDLLLGSINAGFFVTDEEKAEKRVINCCRHDPGHLDEDEALRLYHAHISPATMNVAELLVNMRLIAEYLGNSYRYFKDAHDDATLKNVSLHMKSTEDSIVAHSIEYIRRNYNKKLNASDVARFCHCSVSQLSHVFKTRVGVSLNTYVNKIRLEISKTYLLESDKSINEIAALVGYYDPNYFSRVFGQLMDISPTEFRRRFKDDI